MIGSVKVGAFSLRLNFAAMQAIEASHDGKSVLEVIGGLDEKVKTGDLAKLMAPCMNDGEGAPLDDVGKVVDAVGFMGAVEAFMAAVEAAFPDSKKGASGKKTTVKRKSA